MSANPSPNATPGQPASDLIRRELPSLAGGVSHSSSSRFFAVVVVISIYVKFPETVRAAFVLISPSAAPTPSRRRAAASLQASTSKMQRKSKPATSFM
jgi:hypothetical protein